MNELDFCPVHSGLRFGNGAIDGTHLLFERGGQLQPIDDPVNIAERTVMMSGVSPSFFLAHVFHMQVRSGDGIARRFFQPIANAGNPDGVQLFDHGGRIGKQLQQGSPEHIARESARCVDKQFSHAFFPR